MSDPLVSVVIPVLNGADFLEEAIRSVLNQSYQNWLLFILDNNSSDDTHAIASTYAERDNRIQLERNSETLPLMENWNRSMSLISPDSGYCKVVHADDWMFPNCLQEMVALGEAHPGVALISAYRLEDEFVAPNGLHYPSHECNGREIIRHRFLEGGNLFGSPSTVMYRADQVLGRTKFFNESNVHADTEICYEILLHHNFGFVHQVLTFTRRHGGSLSSYGKRMMTYRPADLLMLQNQGKQVLSQSEYKQIYRRKLKAYYRVLGYRLLKFKILEDRTNWHSFWHYHKQAFESLGENFSWLRVFKGSLDSLYKTIVSRFELH